MPQIFFNMISQGKKLTLVALALVLALAYILYFPGLSSNYIMDDYQNLHGLEYIKSPHIAKEAAEYVLSGISGPLGRPVSLLTFALQHDAWPMDPHAFRQVNLILHLLNGVLLYWLLRKLCTHLTMDRKEGIWVSLFTTAAWLMHPMQVSTVLYIVQRMTELCALFTLGGLIAYVYGRERLVRNESISGYVWLSVGIVLAGLLATLSKENGVLLLVFVLVLEMTLLSGLPRPRYWLQWSALFLYAPLVFLVTHFAINWDNILAAYTQREFDLTQRLLTESRILFNYIINIVLPRPSAFGVLFDDYPVSKSLLEPATTLPSIVALLVLLFVALKFRKQLPVLSFGVLWFFCGHLLESTVIPLELYFEHRNYLPMVGVLFPAAYYVTKMHGSLRVVGVSAGAIMLVLIAVITWSEARLWSNPYIQATIWAAEKPLSNRAQEYLAGVSRVEHNNLEAVKVYQRMVETHPQDARGYTEWLELGCRDPDLPLPDTQLVLARLRVSDFSNVPFGMLLEITEMREKDQCQRLKFEDLQHMLSALLENPRYKYQKKNLYVIQARLYASEGQLDPAIKAMDQAYAIAPTADDALMQVRWLTSAGLYDDALYYVQKAHEAANRKFITRWLKESDIDSWEQALLLARKQQRDSKIQQ